MAKISGGKAGGLTRSKESRYHQLRVQRSSGESRYDIKAWQRVAVLIRLPAFQRRGVSRTGFHSWRATGDDPYFVFYTFSSLFPYVIFQIWETDRTLTPQLFPDRGHGFSSSDSFSLFQAKDAIYVVSLKLLGEVRRLRFDPSSYQCEFNFRALASSNLTSVKSFIGRRQVRTDEIGREPVWQTTIQLSRHNYKDQWNSISSSDNHAKIAATGIADEAAIASAARAAVAMLQQHVGIGANDVVLEIGAGFGRIGEALAPLCREWIGTDVSENMVEHIKRRLARFANVRAVATNGFDLSQVSSASVDVVYCTVVFPHLDEWERYSYIAEGFRVLRPGGRMLVDGVNLDSDGGWKIFEEIRALRPEGRQASVSKTSTPQELKVYFRRANFINIQQVPRDDMIVTFGMKPS